MFATVDQKELQAALAKIHRVVPGIAPIFIEVYPNRLQVSATKGNVGMTVKIAATETQPGRMLLASKFFTQYVNGLRGGSLTLEEKNDKCILTAGRTKSSVTIIDSTLYTPAKTSENLLRAFALSSSVFKSVIEDVAFLAVKEEDVLIASKVLFCCILIKSSDEGGLDFVASDGKSRMAYRYVPDHVNFYDQILVPAEDMSRFAATLKDGDGEVCCLLSPDNNFVVFADEHSDFFTRTLGGAYPNFKQQYTSEHITTVKIETADLAKAVSLATLYDEWRVHVSVNTHAITIQSSSEIGEHSDELDAEIVGASDAFALPAKYLSEVIPHIKEKVCVIQHSPRKGVIINPEDNRVKYTMMPLIR